MSETKNNFSTNFTAFGWEFSLTAVKVDLPTAENAGPESAETENQDWPIFPTTGNELFDNRNSLYQGAIRLYRHMQDNPSTPPYLLGRQLGIVMGHAQSLTDWYKSLTTATNGQITPQEPRK